MHLPCRHVVRLFHWRFIWPTEILYREVTRNKVDEMTDCMRDEEENTWRQQMGCCSGIL